MQQREMGSTKNRWRITFFPSPPCSNAKTKSHPHPHPPKEFICPISQSLMADPIIITSGQTLEHNCIQACINLNFVPFLSNGFKPDFSTLIPNIAIKSTILKWCDTNRVNRPVPITLNAAEKLIQTLMASQQGESNRRNTHFRINSEESVCSSTSVVVEEGSPEEEKIYSKLKSNQVCQQEEAVIYLRQITRSDPTVRIPLCTPRLLSALRSLLLTKISVLQVNSLAALVNLSLERVNKVKIVRSGLLPSLIEILKCGFLESVEYSVSLLFSLSLDDQNKTAIGVLGGLQPLLYLIKSKNGRIGHESLLAIYHLSLVHTNRSKLIKLGVVPILLSLRYYENCVLGILCNIVMCGEGRAAMLDGNGVKWLVELIKVKNELVSEEKCVEALCELSCGSLRFRGLAKEAGAMEMLSEVVERVGVSSKVKEKAMKMLVFIRDGDEAEKEVEEVDWEDLLMDSGVVSRSHVQLRYHLQSSDANSA